jgi:hypothetical protein
MFQFISRAKSSKWFWYGLLAIVVTIDTVLLARYHIYGGFSNRVQIYRGIGISLFAAFLVMICGGLFRLWRLRNQRLARRKLMLAWCWGALRGGLIASLIMPLLVYEEDFGGPRLIIFAINILEGCPSRVCINYFLGPLTVLVLIPFVLGLIVAIAGARKSWRNHISAETAATEFL